MKLQVIADSDALIPIYRLEGSTFYSRLSLMNFSMRRLIQMLISNANLYVKFQKDCREAWTPTPLLQFIV